MLGTYRYLLSSRSQREGETISPRVPADLRPPCDFIADTEVLFAITRFIRRRVPT